MYLSRILSIEDFFFFFFFLDNASNVFLSEDMQLIDIQGINRKDIFLMSFTDKDQFILTNEDGYVLMHLTIQEKYLFEFHKRVFNLKKYLATKSSTFETKLRAPSRMF